jgi:hypothetical protein
MALSDYTEYAGHVIEQPLPLIRECMHKLPLNFENLVPDYIHTYIHTHTCMHAYIHTYIHTYIHRYMCIPWIQKEVQKTKGCVISYMIDELKPQSSGPDAICISLAHRSIVADFCQFMLCPQGISVKNVLAQSLYS